MTPATSDFSEITRMPPLATAYANPGGTYISYVPPSTVLKMTAHG